MATSSVPERRLASTERATAPVCPGRDRFIDALRAFAILAIVAQHWMLPVLSGGGEIPAAGGTGGWASTWLSPVLPLIFFAGGAAAAVSLRTRLRLARATDRPTSSWLAERIIRLTIPVFALAAVLLPLRHLLIAAGVPAQLVHSTTDLVGRLVWFLAAYALLISLTPVLVRLHNRLQGHEVIVMAAGAVAVDIVRFAGWEGTNWLGAANVVLALGAIYQVGIACSQGGFDHVHRPKLLAIGTGGLAASVFAVVIGPEPPATALLTLAAAQLGLALACRDALSRWAAHRPVGAMLDWIGARSVTIYLWHVPALLVIAGITLVGFGDDRPEPFGADWRSHALWLAALALVLAGFVRAFGRYERRAPRRLAHPDREGRASLNANSPVCRMGSAMPGRKT